MSVALLAFAFSGYSGAIARIRRIERKVNLLLNHAGVDPISERVKQLATDPSRRIEAIKAYRDETGAGLAEAKQAVETSSASGKWQT